MVDKNQADQWNEESKYLDDDDDDILNQDMSKFGVQDEEVDDDAESDSAEETASAEGDDSGDDVDDKPDDDSESDEGDDSDEDGESDEEDDAGAEGEEDSDGGDERGESGEQKDYMMPKSRYDSVKARLDKALDELDQLKKSSSSSTQTTADAGELAKELDEISSQFNEALSTGDVETANKLRAKERALTEQVFELKARNVAAQEVENLRYQDYVATVEAEYPELNEDDPNFSKDLSREVVDLLTAFEKNGYRPVDALKRAVGYVFPNGPTAEGADEAGDASKPSDEVAKKRASKALRRNAEASKKQPPKTKGKGTDSDKGGPTQPLSLADLDDEEFDKLDLDSDEMRKARGDFL